MVTVRFYSYLTIIYIPRKSFIVICIYAPQICYMIITLPVFHVLLQVVQGNSPEKEEKK